MNHQETPEEIRAERDELVRRERIYLETMRQQRIRISGLLRRIDELEQRAAEEAAQK